MKEKSNIFSYPANRLLEFIKNQGITKYEFHKKIGVSNGFLDKSKEIRTDNVRKILDNYPIINVEWLIYGRGSMLLEDGAQPLRVEERAAKYGRDAEQRLEAMEKRLTEITARLEEKEKTWQEFGESFHRMFIKVYDLEQWQDKVDERLGIEQNRSAG